MPAARHHLQLTSISLAILALAGCAQGAAATSGSGLEVEASVAERFEAGDYRLDESVVGCLIRFDVTNNSGDTVEELPGKVTLERDGEPITQLTTSDLVGEDYDFAGSQYSYDAGGPVEAGQSTSWVIAVPCEELDSESLQLNVDGTVVDVNL